MSTSPSASERHGQTALEFLVIMVLLMLVFTSMYSFLGERSTMTVERNIRLQAKDVADAVAYELDLALAQGEGYTRTFDLRPEIGGGDYNVTVVNGTIRLAWADASVFAATAADTVTGTVEPGNNTVTNNGTHLRVNQ